MAPSIKNMNKETNKQNDRDLREKSKATISSINKETQRHMYKTASFESNQDIDMVLRSPDLAAQNAP